MGAAPRSHSSFSGNKAPADLIPKRHALNLLENKIIWSTWIYRPLYPVQRQWHPEGDQGIGKKLGTVTSFKYIYLGAVVSHNGSKPKILTRTAQATTDLTKWMPIWRDSNIYLMSKVKLMPSLVISILLYAYESGTSVAESEQRKTAF